MKKKIEMEKEELQASLEESEGALEVCNGKIIRAGLYKNNRTHEDPKETEALIQRLRLFIYIICWCDLK